MTTDKPEQAFAVDVPPDDFADLDILLESVSEDYEVEVLPPLSAATFPDIATRLRLWQLCARGACRSSRRCRGDQTACVRRVAVPPHVAAWFHDMGEACRSESFEAALADVDLELTTAVTAWCAALRAVEDYKPRRRQRRSHVR